MGISRILLLPNPRFAVVWPLLLVAGTGTGSGLILPLAVPDTGLTLAAVPHRTTAERSGGMDQSQARDGWGGHCSPAPQEDLLGVG